MKLLITGSRNYTDYNGLIEAIDELTMRLQIEDIMDCTPTEILHGGAKGADQLAEKYAKMYNIKCTVIRPDYIKYNGTIAPLMRNTELVKKAECTIALYGEGRDGKGGTADTATKTKRAGKHLLERRSNGTHKHTPPAPEQGTLW